MGTTIHTPVRRAPPARVRRLHLYARNACNPYDARAGVSHRRAAARGFRIGFERWSARLGLPEHRMPRTVRDALPDTVQFPRGAAVVKRRDFRYGINAFRDDSMNVWRRLRFGPFSFGLRARHVFADTAVNVWSAVL